MKNKLKQKGFTIVELLIVIVVIGILALLVISTFAGIQQKARDTERQTDVKAIHGQIEVYFTNIGNYPLLSELNDSTWRDTNLKGLDQEALKNPKGTLYTLAAAASATQYGYAVTDSAGGACDNTAADLCVEYTLSTILEDGTTYSKVNLN